MTVIGLNYSKITAERTGNPANTEINTVPRITDVKDSKIEGFGAGMDVVSMQFVFESTYKPKVGMISIEGVLLYKPKDAKEKEEIMKAWKKDKKLPALVHIEAVNHLFRKVSLQALHLAELMQLPPVVNLPRLKMEPVSEKKK